MNGNSHRAVDDGASNGACHAHLPATSIVQDEIIPLPLLVGNEDEHIREVCRTVAESSGMRVMKVSTAEEAIELLAASAVDMLLTDLCLPGTSGLELLRRVTQTHPDIAVEMLTQYGTIDSAVRTTRMGAVDYVTKPFRVEELRARLK